MPDETNNKADPDSRNEPSIQHKTITKYQIIASRSGGVLRKAAYPGGGQLLEAEEIHRTQEYTHRRV